MNWSEARKSYRSPQNAPTTIPRFSTPTRTEKTHKRDKIRQCPFHFNQPSHICLTCRKSICLRCAITYCHQHVIHTQQEILPVLKEDLQRFHIMPRVEQVEMKISQSQERQQYLQKKVLRLIQNIQIHFEYLSDILNKKKLQIIQYYDQEFQTHLEDYKKYDQEMNQKLQYLKNIQVEDQITNLSSIEEIDNLVARIQKIFSPQSMKTEKKITKLLMGKDKIKIEKIWSQENLQKVLFEIENIVYRMDAAKVDKRKKRVTTQNALDCKIVVKSSSNSRIPSGRKIDN